MSTSDEGGVLGADGYRDPMKERNPNYTYGPECDMFSFGVVLAVSLAGSFSKGENAVVEGDERTELLSDQRSVFHKYVGPGKYRKGRHLEDDVDP